MYRSVKCVLLCDIIYFCAYSTQVCELLLIFASKVKSDINPNYQHLRFGLRLIINIKVIPLNCIAHPFCTEFSRHLARARARAHTQHYGFSFRLSSEEK